MARVVEGRLLRVRDEPCELGGVGERLWLPRTDLVHDPRHRRLSARYALGGRRPDAHARDDERRAAEDGFFGALDLDVAQAALAERLQARMVTESGHVHARDAARLYEIALEGTPAT